MNRRLYRCRHDRQLAGVASGIAEYFDVDPTLVRVLWIISVFFGGFTLLLYLVLAFVMPLEPIAGSGPLASTGRPEGDPAMAGDPSLAGDAAAATSTWAVPAAEHWHGTSGPVGHEHRPRGEGRFGLALGALLVAFGSFALAGQLFPGVVSSLALGPAFVIALGVALVVYAMRRPATES